MALSKFKHKYITTNERRSTIYHPYVNSRIHQLFNVCTGRFVENLHGNVGSIRAELERWVEFLALPYQSSFSDYDWNMIVYKPQLLIAVTNLKQPEAIQALTDVGFIPSEPVFNQKYGKEYNLITWTYALNTPPKEDA